MAEDFSNPLLSLIKERDLIDDLQYEEVLSEVKRSGNPVHQILQDFGLMDLDAILQVEATHLGAEVVSLGKHELSPDIVHLIPAKMARMYQCLPVGMSNS